MNWGWSLAILCGGFIGLSGAGLVLSRWEYLVTLQITMCLVTWMVASQEPVPLWGTVSVLAVHLFAILLSLFVHPQGLLVMPLSFLTCVYLLRSHRWLAVGVGGLLVLLSVQSLVHNQFRCPEDPELEAVIAKTHGVVLTNQLAGYSLIERMVHRAVHFERQFFFQYVEAMSIPVPQLPEAVALIVNPPIAVVVSFNLLGLVLGFAYALRLLWRAHYVTLRRRQWWLFVKNVAVDARALWALSAFLVLFYSLFDFGGVFYRAHFRNLLSALLLAIAGVHIAEAVGLKWLKRWSILSSATCIVSALVAWFFLTPQLAQGYESYYVSLQRDWPTFNNRVRALANRCGITKDDEHVVVDVATYNAMREHPRTLDFLYVWYDEYLKGTLDPDRTPQEWLNLYKRFSTSGYVVRCQTLQFAKLPIQYRDADICCLGF
ncbi:hypothetical protein SAMN04488498_12022 [Mesorhizobium albiziae]|uniref:Uncharacterized protein n=2 Tax=Neomesorhizobium albiziae TaxID=335020 RepID=A0A1I4DUM9_9HYPH|nr:hypothetical protein GCM10007937_44830 [Mesorhizobium albiziae]SFK97332.1 hypothetical protein SAMN04488498_12022 [Mesorhizobium albiziae]